GLSAAKKRAHIARRRLKEDLPMAPDLLIDPATPPDGDRDVVRLFAAIHRHDGAAAERLLAADPGLVHVEEDWTPSEGLAAGLANASHATPLVRAAGAGDLRMVRRLVRSGADPNRVCGCAGAETALWAATVAGAGRVVGLLLA